MRAGGTITGEHGVGLDKRELLPLVFSEADMNAMLSVRSAFDPMGLCNPGKVIPMLRGCGEGKAVATSTEAAAVATALPAMSRPRHSTKSFVKTQFDPASAAPLVAQIAGQSSYAAYPLSLHVFPTSTEQVSELLRLAFREHWSVLPAGGMTWVSVKAESEANLIINTRRLDQIVEHEPADLVAITQSGVKLTEFNATLRENGQWLPIDPPDDGRATIGGVVATGLGGAQQFGYGRPRGSVIGMKVVLANGDVIRVGGRVVKNVAGYDLCKLFTGSFGSLGIITEVNFKLRPRPEREATIAGSGPIADLITSARAILDARLFPVAAEIVSPIFADRLGITTRSTSPVLLVRFAGNEKGVRYQVEASLAKLENAEVIDNDGKLWQDVAAAGLWDDYRFSRRAKVLPAELLTFCDHLAPALAESTWQIGALDGRVIIADDSTSTLDAEPRELMLRVKQQLDPRNVFPNIFVEAE